MTKKTIILRNFLISTLLILLAVIFVFMLFVIAANNYRSKPISEESYFEGKSIAISSDVNTKQLNYTLELCNAAITEAKGENIIDSYISVWSDNGLLTFTYYYYSDKGFFKVATSGNTNKLACLIDNSETNPFCILFDIKYEEEVLKVSEGLSTPESKYNLEAINEETFYAEKPNIANSDVKDNYLKKTKELCRSAIIKKTGEKIHDHYIIVWTDDTGSLTFSYVYRSDKGFFKVPSIGNDNMIARSITNETATSKEVSSYDIEYDGNVLKVTCE